VYGLLVADGCRLALAFVDGFGVPDELLAAPIATGGGWRAFNALPPL
jgi:hypothetical protein